MRSFASISTPSRYMRMVAARSTDRAAARFVERAGLDADRQDVLLPQGEAAGIAAPPDPLDRLHFPRQSDYQIANC